jgi:hypothetical protein
MRRLTRYEKALDAWRAAIRDGWLHDHPGKTLDDYKRALSPIDSIRARSLKMSSPMPSTRTPPFGWWFGR